ncbi:MFS general substrate transporter [Lentithecium fluviatile CBS 122367]|uniref:MFS general substrate transporter n=1 Tax=Lentithecium fluviatile CBS 122367 TaxID=1168545 RepID=A0A6G1J337_9PLEO|nr:MFS general substrate transporter [Lentithecium fluviatile CBS 122367]
MAHTTPLRNPEDTKKTHNLGSLQLRHHESNQIILIPTPTNDPNDPLNWSARYRWYIAVVVCAAIFFCNFLAAGPTVAILEITADFYGAPQENPNFVADISKTAYFFTTTALMQGMGAFFWMPLIIKYGRRPVYVSSFVLYTICAVWAGASMTPGSELASRIIMGVAAGAAEVLAPLTLSDIFFLHERGTVMGVYTCALSAGVSGGIIVSGLISIKHNWRVIYWVSTALIGACTILVIFTFPETIYLRDDTATEAIRSGEETKVDMAKNEVTETEEAAASMVIPEKRSYLSSLRLYSGIYTQESILTLFIRPVVLFILPQVFWATLVMAGTIGFLVAITSNFGSAFSEAYNFQPWQSGLCFIAALIGAFIGIFVGGKFSDWVADIQTRRNGGIREPEMRLPAILVSVVTAPLALVLYGVGIHYKLHWICATIGLGLINFSIVQATNISLVYTIDCYRPVSGEITVTQMAFKSALGFLLSFYTNTWVLKSGYLNAYGAMAGISGGLLVLGVPFYFWGHSMASPGSRSFRGTALILYLRPGILFPKLSNMYRERFS